MAKRRPVVHVSSGEVFRTAAEAERRFNLPNSVLAECIRLGKPCHGEMFRYADEVDASSEKASSEVCDSPSDVDHVENDKQAVADSPKVSEDLLSGFPTIKFNSDRGDIDVSYTGGSSDKEYALRYFSEKGYDVEEVGGVLMFYGTELDDVYRAVLRSGYRSSWGVSYRENSKESDE